MMKETERLYDVSDDAMYQGAIAMQVMFQNDQHMFRSKLPNLFAEDYNEIFKAEIEDIGTIYSDKHYQHEKAHETSVFDSYADQLHEQSIGIFNYVMIAFPDAPHIQKQFKLDKLNSTKNSRIKFVANADNYALLVKEHSVKLKASSCPEPLLKKVEELQKQVVAHQFTRSQAVSERSDVKNTRIIYRNAVWKKMEQISSAAESVFYGNADQIARYALPRRKSKKKETPVPVASVAE